MWLESCSRHPTQRYNRKHGPAPTGWPEITYVQEFQVVPDQRLLGPGVVCHAGQSGSQGLQQDDGAYRQLNVYTEVLQRIRTDYVEEPNIQTVTDGALHGLLESLDANSSYLSPAEYKKYKHLGEQKAGVGAAVSKRFGYAAVIAVIPGGPAEKAGIANGDILEAIEGKSTREMSLAEIHGVLGGEPGSTITVSVVRPRRAVPEKVTITREVAKEPAATARMLEDGIGMIAVDSFPKGRTQEIAGKIKELQRQGAKKLLLDLRNCGDGEEAEGIATANLFLNHGLIAYMQGQTVPPAGLQCRSGEGCHRSAVGGDGEPQHRWSCRGGSLSGSRQRARRRAGR